MKSTYETMSGDYLLPDFEVPECPKVGVWGERRRKYLREHQKALYTVMTLSDTLNAHLEEVDRAATEMYDHLTLQLAVREGITEQLKTDHQMGWVQRMNNIHWPECSIGFRIYPLVSLVQLSHFGFHQICSPRYRLFYKISESPVFFM